MLAKVFSRWFSSAPRRRSHSRSNRVQLRLTCLEGRITPSAPLITNFAGRIIGDTWVLTGHVTDDTTSTPAVGITGDVSGSATVLANGDFYFLATHPSIGVATPTVRNIYGQDVATTVVKGGNQAPFLTMAVTYNQRTSVTLSGVVVDQHPSGLTVTFSGKVTGTATTDTSGHYSYTANATALGDVNGVT